MVKGIDALYEQIAKKVAIEMAESLVKEMRTFPKLMYVPDAKAKNAFRSRRPVIRKISTRKKVTDLASNPMKPSAQSSLDTAVKQRSDEGATITPPENPEKPENPENANT